MSETTSYPVGHSTRYPTIQDIPIVLHLGGHTANGAAESVKMKSTSTPQIHMNASAVDALKELIVWKDFPPCTPAT